MTPLRSDLDPARCKIRSVIGEIAGKETRPRPRKVPPAGQLLFWGRAGRPAPSLLAFTGLAADPELSAFGAF